MYRCLGEGKKGTWRTARLGSEQHQVMVGGGISGSRVCHCMSSCGFAGDAHSSGRRQSARGPLALQTPFKCQKLLVEDGFVDLENQ